MLWAGLVFGLMGSFHCVGMCGAIALALPGAGQSNSRYVFGRVLYNAGRITTYSLLGLAAGLAGRSLQIAGWQQSISILSGLLILLLVALPEQYLSRAAAFVKADKVLFRVKQTLAYYLQRTSPQALYFTGVLNGLLPCGLVYLALPGALAANNPVHAMAFMALFGLGTVPLMLGLSLSGKMVPMNWRMHMRKAVPFTAAFMAVLIIVRGLDLGIPYLSPKAAAPASCHQSQTLSCCQSPNAAAIPYQP